MHSLAPALLLASASAAAASHVLVPWTSRPWLHSSVNIGTVLTTRDNGTADDELLLQAANNMTGGGYYAEFAVGTPPQKLSFLLDTGSSDTWVNAAESNLCGNTFLQSRVGYCMASFEPDDSQTFDVVDRDGFDITYLDGRRIQGDYFNDTVTIDGHQIDNQQLGLAQKSVRPTGIMGLGFGANVATRDRYPTIIESMVAQGLIDTAAYSLYLNSVEADAGSILFGGIDQQKFIGDLAILPLQSDSLRGAQIDRVAHFNVKLAGFRANAPDGADPLDLPDLESGAILDSGSTISLLPSDQVRAIHDRFDVVSIEGLLQPFIDCKWAGPDGDGYSFDFAFDGKTIRVPLDEMVVDAYAGMQDQLKRDAFVQQYMGDWDEICIFGMADVADFGYSGDAFTLLGDTFLRSAYVVYDLANEQLGLAQANLGSNGTDIVEITSGDLPRVKGVDGQQDFGDEGAAGTLPSPAAVALVMTVAAVVASL